MRKEKHYRFILLTGITIKLGTDQKIYIYINQLHLAEREIEMVRTGLEMGTKKSTVLKQVQFQSTSEDSY